MSYLNLPRINFAGRFEADVNTVNNDVRNFAADSFEPRFQTPMKTEPGNKTEYNGWWNPNGSNRFSLYQCVVTGVIGPDGASVGGAATADLTLVAQFERTAAKIVDLDPQFQMASGLWGLRVALMSGSERLLEGNFVPASFRDLFFGRLVDAAGNPVGGSNGASARFTGVLAELSWGDTGASYVQALKQSADANEGRLSFSLVTYGYRVGGKAAGLAGSVIGSLGPWLKGEPLSFAPGRRFAVSGASPNQPFASASNIGYFTAAVTDSGKRLALDFGVSWPLQLAADQTIQPQDLGPITVAVAKIGDTVSQGPNGLNIAPGLVEDQAVTADLFEVITVLNGYSSSSWLHETGGVLDVSVPEAARALLQDHPLLLLAGTANGGQKIAIRECLGGVWARADNFVQRLDAAATGWVSSQVAVWAMRWGQPWPGAPLAFSIPPLTGQGGTGDNDEVNPPQVTIPDNNVPLATVFIPPNADTGADGTVTVMYWAADPGNPRGYIDGQVYQFNYGPAVTGGSPMPPFEVIVVHVRDAFVPPAVPSWETDVRPVLVQYSNLYPIMSKGLFSLADFSQVSANARLLRLAFTVPPTDPNYMPATRDLSAGKLRMIVDWLASFLPEFKAGNYGAIPPLPVGMELPKTVGAPVSPRPAAPAIPPDAARAAVAALGPGVDGKTAAAREFLKNAARRDNR